MSTAEECLVCVTHGESQTAALGAQLALALPSTAVVSLEGPLGAGKTRLVQAIAAALGVPREAVTSPTFVLMQHYRGHRDLFHCDAYRLKDDAEFLDLGVEECFAGPGISLVEWGDRVRACLPPDRLEIIVEPIDTETRRFNFVAKGPAHATIVRRLREIRGAGP